MAMVFVLATLVTIIGVVGGLAGKNYRDAVIYNITFYKPHLDEKETFEADHVRISDDEIRYCRTDNGVCGIYNGHYRAEVKGDVEP